MAKPADGVQVEFSLTPTDAASLTAGIVVEFCDREKTEVLSRYVASNVPPAVTPQFGVPPGGGQGAAQEEPGQAQEPP